MTAAEQQKLKALFVAMSLYYGHEIPDAALGLYVADLDDLSFTDVDRVLSEIRRDPKTRKCPLPADVRARLTPEIDPEAHAALIANEIVYAIARIGPYQTPKLSDEAMEIVRLEGGWEQLCGAVTNDNLNICKAQWRGLAKAVMGGERSVQALLEDRRRSGRGELTALGANLQLPDAGDPSGDPLEST